MNVPVENEMTFWDHLDELRKILFRIGIFVTVLAVIFFSYMRQIFDTVILAPTQTDFFFYRWLNDLAIKLPILPDFCIGEFHVNIININLASQFFVHISTSFWFALVFSFPFVIYQLFVFVRPALYNNERKNAGAAFFFGNILFYMGVAVGYFLVFPLTLRFLAGYDLSSYIENSVSLDSYMNSFLMLCFIMGIVFELPLLSWVLSQIGILKQSFFNKFRKHAVVVLLVLAAFITPSSDPFTLMVVFLPIYLLWEVSAMVVKK